jgi:hypothetical protein
MTVEVAEVQVAHVDDLLARLTVPRRKKDVARVKRLRELQRKVAAPCPKGDDSWSAA